MIRLQCPLRHVDMRCSITGELFRSIQVVHPRPVRRQRDRKKLRDVTHCAASVFRVSKPSDTPLGTAPLALFASAQALPATALQEDLSLPWRVRITYLLGATRSSAHRFP